MLRSSPSGRCFFQSSLFKPQTWPLEASCYLSPSPPFLFLSVPFTLWTHTHTQGQRWEFLSSLFHPLRHELFRFSTTRTNYCNKTVKEYSLSEPPMSSFPIMPLLALSLWPIYDQGSHEYIAPKKLIIALQHLRDASDYRNSPYSSPALVFD